MSLTLLTFYLLCLASPANHVLACSLPYRWKEQVCPTGQSNGLQLFCVMCLIPRDNKIKGVEQSEQL